MTDNGPSETYSFSNIISYHPRGNGEAESAVRTLKDAEISFDVLLSHTCALMERKMRSQELKMLRVETR